MADVKVFVSYSWRIDASKNIVDALDKPAHERSVKLLRDKKELKIGEYIKVFMQQIAEAEHAVVVFSKPYFQSEYCLWELMHLFQHKGYQQSIYPILADDIDLNDSGDFITFWEQQRDALQADIDAVGAGKVPAKVERLNLFENFIVNIDVWMNRAGGILAQQTKDMAENDFSSLLDLIREIPKVPPGTIFHPRDPDEAFMKQAKTQVMSALDDSNILRIKLAEELGIEGLKEQSDSLTDELLSRCCEDDFEDLLRDDVFLAAKSAIEDLDGHEDNHSPQLRKDMDQLTGSADSLFSCLLLYAIRTDWMDQYCKSCQNSGSNLRQLPFNAPAAIEIFTSRYLQRFPRFELTPTEAVGLEGLAVLEHGFEQDDVVTGILRQIWVKVFPMDLAKNFQGNDAQLRKLRSQIKSRHKRRSSTKNNYYCIVPGDASHALANPDVRAELMQKIPELPLIILHVEGGEEALLIPDDYDLASLIFDFYELLNKYRPYEPEKDNRRPEQN